MNSFKETTDEYLGEKLTCGEFEELGIPDIPEFLPYSGEDQNKATFPDLDDEVTPELGDKHIHASTMLALGGQIVCSTLKARPGLQSYWLQVRQSNP